MDSEPPGMCLTMNQGGEATFNPGWLIWHGNRYFEQPLKLFQVIILDAMAFREIPGQCGIAVSYWNPNDI